MLDNQPRRRRTEESGAMSSALAVILPDEEIAREHAGKWIAIKDRTVIASSAKASDVHRALKSERVRGAVLQYVPPAPPPQD